MNKINPAGHSGFDTATFIRPFQKSEPPSGLRVDYRYRPENGIDQSIPLDAAYWSALDQALSEENSQQKYYKRINSVCPIPANVSEEDREVYYNGPYIDAYYRHLPEKFLFPLWLDKECHVAWLLSFNGYYDRKGGLSIYGDDTRSGIGLFPEIQPERDTEEEVLRRDNRKIKRTAVRVEIRSIWDTH